MGHRHVIAARLPQSLSSRAPNGTTFVLLELQVLEDVSVAVDLAEAVRRGGVLVCGCRRVGGAGLP